MARVASEVGHRQFKEPAPWLVPYPRLCRGGRRVSGV